MVNKIELYTIYNLIVIMPYIYLVHCRASVNSNENVYKIGKSIDFNKRLSGYDKGTIPIFTIYVQECDNFERQLITLFESNYQPRKDYGNEYFQGDIRQMIQDIMTEFNKCNLCYEINTNENISNTQNQEKIDDKPKINDNKLTENLIKMKRLLIAKLNKVKISNVYDYVNNVKLNSNDFNNSQYFYMLQNNVQPFIYNTTQYNNKLKFGDYLEQKYTYISNLCYAIYYTDDSDALKLAERLKISI